MRLLAALFSRPRSLLSGAPAGPVWAATVWAPGSNPQSVWAAGVWQGMT